MSKPFMLASTKCPISQETHDKIHHILGPQAEALGLGLIVTDSLVDVAVVPDVDVLIAKISELTAAVERLVSLRNVIKVETKVGDELCNV